MTLAPGNRIGPYEVVSSLGAGGMGEVYRARDTRLKRDVAIKILPDSFASDPDRVARFQREAEVLASLNHPHIAQIYGVEDRALVLELVDGPTLADRITKGPIPIGEALPIARQITEALEAAHERGVVHRDLKPGNIKITDDGTVKVLDFGLAKALEQAPGSGLQTAGEAHVQLSQSPTITSPALVTGAAVLLGTAAYMSPEQAKGRPADKRSDMWAFGCVLYEMLTGRRPFPGDDVSDTLASVLAREPDWTALPQEIPSAVPALLRRCLQRDRTRRLDSAAVARLEIEDALALPAVDAPPAAKSRNGSNGLAWTVAAAALLGVVALAVPAIRYLRQPPPAAPPETRLEINTPPTADPLSFALSPDGTQIVYAADGEGGSRLWLRPLDSTTARPLAGTDRGSLPFWSPDSQSIGFFADDQLKRLDLKGGQPRVLTPAGASISRGAWNEDGIILFAPSPGSTLFRVAASGGTPVAVTTMLAGQGSQRSPRFLPGGRHFLYHALGSTEASGIYLGSLGSPDVTRLTPSDTAGAYWAAAPSADARENGWLLWVQRGVLRAQRLDLDRRQLVGDSVTLADPVAYDAIGVGAFSASANGMLAYRGGMSTRRQLTWVHRTGKVLGVAGAPDEGDIRSPRISPDGRQVAVTRTVQGNTDIWLLDGLRTPRFTFDEATDVFPVWSPDGKQIVFSSLRNGMGLWVKPVGRAQAEESLGGPGHHIATDWSRDGRFLLFVKIPSSNLPDLWVNPFAGDDKPWMFLGTPFAEQFGTFSPDGRWVAYMSNESGRDEIYIRPFAEPGGNPNIGQWQASTAGGIHPTWRADGQELYYLAPDGQMMAVPVAVRGGELQLEAPTALFPAQIVGGGVDMFARRYYDVAPDGRFLITRPVGEAVPITVIQNWRPKG